MATMDITMEAPIIASEAETDPAAPAAGEGAEEDAGESWAKEVEAEKRATAMKRAKTLNVETEAITRTREKRRRCENCNLRLVREERSGMAPEFSLNSK